MNARLDTDSITLHGSRQVRIQLPQAAEADLRRQLVVGKRSSRPRSSALRVRVKSEGVGKGVSTLPAEFGSPVAKLAIRFGPETFVCAYNGEP